MKKETITQVLVMVLKRFKMFFNGSTVISKIRSKKNLIKNLKRGILSKNLVNNPKKGTLP